MEFLRFGSSIPGGYWGCCAVCIIQNFKFEPTAKASIELVSGDGGNPLIGSDGKSKFAGPTYEDVFNTRLRIGTFSDDDMPNHVFLAVLTEDQIRGSVGKKWLAILRKNGFEFIRTTDNSVYTGTKIATPGEFEKLSPHRNFLFGLFRNIGKASIQDTLTPPSEWTALPDPYNGDMSSENVQKVQIDLWNAIGAPKFLTEAEVVAAGAPVIVAGRRRDGAAPEPKATRDAREKKPKKADPFAPAISKAEPTAVSMDDKTYPWKMPSIKAS